jgi:hypothetical protein
LQVPVCFISNLLLLIDFIKIKCNLQHRVRNLTRPRPFTLFYGPERW